MTDDLRDIVASRLRGIRQRLTPNREAIVDVLAASSRPLTIPEVLKTRSGLAQSSVYRNLVVLVDAGVVHRIVTNDEFARFELAEDLLGHHHHLICSECGRVEDVPPNARLEQSLRHAADQIASATGFHTHTHRIDLVGLCRRCA
ncbi:MAG TPA: Fur family transcriptional regulator [Acidimicrobiia bacterium]|nr:Fur family transcriptional regulator [Acidimicrobiia bacterium]